MNSSWFGIYYRQNKDVAQVWEHILQITPNTKLHAHAKLLKKWILGWFRVQ
jgi:hypothetical protein